MRITRKSLTWGAFAGLLSVLAQFAASRYAFENLFFGSPLADYLLLVAVFPIGLLGIVFDAPAVLIVAGNAVFWGLCVTWASAYLSQNTGRGATI